MTLHGFIRSPGIGKASAQGFMKGLFVGRGQGKGSGIPKIFFRKGFRTKSKYFGTHGSKQPYAVRTKPVRTLQHAEHRK